jgi:ssDNA-binding Zn-finger/Zn-ribbon topoisomerase 1
MANQKAGDQGEKEIVEKVPCPNCGRKLRMLPKNNPLYDVQCVTCVFRAQVKTNNHKPKKVIFGAGWQIVDKVLKSGYQIPPLLVNFKWTEKGKKKQAIYFYPFIQRENLKKHLANIKSRNRKYWMFNYVGLDKLPKFEVYKK